MLSRAFIPVQKCFVTMVAIDSKGKSYKNIPRLVYESPEEEAAAEVVRNRLELSNKYVRDYKTQMVSLVFKDL